MEDLTRLVTTSHRVWDTGQNYTETTWLPESGNLTTGPLPKDGDIQPRPLNWPVLCLLIIIVIGIMANLLVVVVVGLSSRLHTAHFIICASLATSDILKAVTIMPMSITRMFFESNIPALLCWAWNRVYLGVMSITLVHLVVGMLLCQLTVIRPMCCSRSSPFYYVKLQVVAAWVVPLILLCPYMLLETVSSMTPTCLPLDRLYSLVAVLPLVIVPVVGALFVYALTAWNIRCQQRMIQRLQNEENSDTDSNGFVTFENSVASEHDETIYGTTAGKVVSQDVPSNIRGSVKMADGNGSTRQAAREKASPEVLNKSHNMDHSPPEKAQLQLPSGTPVVVGEYESGESQKSNASAEEVDLQEIILDSQQVNGQRQKITNDKQCLEENEAKRGEGHDNEALAVPLKVCCRKDDGEENITPACASNKTLVNVVTLSGKQGNNDETAPDMEQADVNVVRVKAKVGKEALNEPLEDEWPQTQPETYLFQSNVDRLWGLDNAGFEGDTLSDTPLADSIQVRQTSTEKAKIVKPTQDSCREESLGSFNNQLIGGSSSSEDPSPLETSSRSSSGGADDASSNHRSILKRSGSKRNSNKSVQFNLPKEEGLETSNPKPRLLSCKYKTRNRNRGGTALSIDPKNASNSQAVCIEQLKGMNSKTTLSEKGRQEAAIDLSFMARGQRSRRSRFESRLNTQKANSKLLLGMLGLSVGFSVPYLAFTCAVTIHPNIVVNTGVSSFPSALLSFLEWVGFVPFIVYPFFYLTFSLQFRKAVTVLRPKPTTTVLS